MDKSGDIREIFSAVEGRVTEPDRIETIKSLICQLQGILAAQVVTNKEGELVEIHVLSDYKRNPKQIVRDVESALLTQFGIRIDHKKISVAQIEREGKGEFPQVEPRIVIKGVNYSVLGSTCEAQVILSRGGVESIGSASGPASRRNVMRLTARATVEALKKFWGVDYHLEVEEVVSVHLAQRDVVVILLNSFLGKKEVELVGSSVVHNELQQAVVSATLDGVNRYLGSQTLSHRKE